MQTLRYAIARFEAESTIIETSTSEHDTFYQVFEHPRYMDRGPLSHGAFGDVRRVHDKHADCALAIKIMRSHLVQSPRLYGHFVTEIEILSELRCPGILPLRDWGQFNDGRVWFTMPEVRGGTFAAVITELHARHNPQPFLSPPSRWTFRSALELLAQLCQTVAHAHDRGIVHRDLKPENMLIDESGQTFLIDWGIAKRMTGTASSLGGLFEKLKCQPAPVEHGDVVGTPAYMSPEQAFGDTLLQSPASDVYSLGAILYHLLAGRPPYRGSRAAVIADIKRGFLRPISEVVATSRPLPTDLVALCETAMQRAPAARRVDARAIARNISNWLNQNEDQM